MPTHCCLPKATLGDHCYLSFADFMHHALYAPSSGYYQSPDRQGTKGDYITAASNHPLFAQCIAHTIGTWLTEHPSWSWMEIGPGNGQLALAIAQYLDQLGLRRSFWLIESCEAKIPFLQQRLSTKLPPHLIAQLHLQSDLPKDFQGVVLANEILDAMPVHLVQSDVDGRCSSLSVSYHQGTYQWLKRPLLPHIKQAFSARNIPKMPNYRYEISLSIPAWCENISQSLTSGKLLLLDYGYPRKLYYHPLRSTGTLCTYKDHTVSDNPLQFIGNQDISCHVDFTLLAESLCASGFKPEALLSQGAFLLQSNMEDFLQKALTAPHASSTLCASARQLLHPSEMGTLVCAMIAAKNAPLSNTWSQDLLHTL